MAKQTREGGSDALAAIAELDPHGNFSKEAIFNYIVDLDQHDFDALCNQIISLYRFQQRFEDALVSDGEEFLKPWLPVLTKVELAADPSGSNFQKKHFYNFLSDVTAPALSSMCTEIMALYRHARDNGGTYIVSQVYPAVAGMVEVWRIQFKRRILFSDLPARILNWQEMLLFSEV